MNQANQIRRPLLVVVAILMIVSTRRTIILSTATRGGRISSSLLFVNGFTTTPYPTNKVSFDKVRSIQQSSLSTSSSFIRWQLLVHTTTTGNSRLFSTSSSEELTTEEKQQLEDAIQKKGDEIRALKASGVDKATLQPYITELQSLKAQLDPTLVVQEKSKPAKKQEQDQQPKQQQQSKQQDDEEDFFVTAREVDYSKWYNDIIRVTGLAEPSPVRGCMVIKPWGMSIWDRLRNYLDEKIKDHGAENAYFPLLIPQSFLAKEAEHVDGFAKECAVVTHHRLKIAPPSESNDDEANGSRSASGGNLIVDPDAKLEDPLIIRPTSETMIWYMFKKWIVSYRDLPLKVNQWANVMRWEMRTRPFLRTSEFLWQEGHTAHATAESAEQDAKDVLELYATTCEEFLAIPVIRGRKSPSERFAGAAETYTIEALMQNGWALQSGTSHFLGQSFGTAFDVTYQDVTGAQQVVWGTSWGVSTRLIGALIMTHSDNAGLVLPPKIAPHQVVIVPIPPNKKDTEAVELMTTAIASLVQQFKDAGVRVKVDDRDYIRTGAKFFEWERKGVPLRIEIGPRDVRQSVCILKYRTGTMSNEKQTIPLDDVVSATLSGLETYQNELYSIAKQRLDAGISTTMGVTYQEMRDALINDEASSYPGRGLYLVPWKCDATNENAIKEDCKATIRCYPLDHENHEYESHDDFETNAPNSPQREVGQQYRKSSSILRETSVTSSDGYGSSNIKTVWFSEIIIYEFPNMLGDNPATSTGSPLTIGWNHHSKNIVDVDFYEYLRSSGNPRRSRRELQLKSGERDSYLLGLGYKLEELMDVSEEVRKIRESRLRNMKDSKWMKLVGVLDTAAKGVVNTTVDVGKGVFDVSKIIVIDGIIDPTTVAVKGTTKVATVIARRTSTNTMHVANATYNVASAATYNVASVVTSVVIPNLKLAKSA